MLLLKAKYLLTGPNTVVENGAVLTDGTKIVFAGNYKDVSKKISHKTIDLDNSAIVPGLINTHTHLELTNLHNSTNYNGKFTDWLSKIINAKTTWTNRDYILSIREGIAKSIEAGTTTIADLTGNGLAYDELRNCKLRKNVFFELIDFNPDTASNTIEDLKERINNITDCDVLASIGIFPHAPYTVSEELYKQCSLVSKDLNICMSTHLSETNDEIEFLEKGVGNFVSLLNSRNMLDNWKHPGTRPIKYLSNMGILNSNCMLVHCNYVSDEEIEVVKKSKSSIVFCPKSHNYFQHKNHPFKKFIENGINVSLGTDSLASNSSLSILDEMKFVYGRHKDIRPQDIFHMGTIGGAVALGLKGYVGKLVPGFEADITVIKMPEGRTDGFYDGIFSEESECILSIVAGHVCYDKNKLATETHSFPSSSLGT